MGESTIVITLVVHSIAIFMLVIYILCNKNKEGFLSNNSDGSKDNLDEIEKL